MSSEKEKTPTVSAVEVLNVNNPNQKGINVVNSTEVSAIRAIAVPFHGANLYVVEHDGQPYTPMKPIVQAIGLDWKSQHRKVAANEARWGMVNLTTPSAGGDQGMTCLPVRKVAAWLTTIEPGKVKDLEVRARVIQYQNECDDALWQYWNEGAAFNPRALSVNTSITPAQCQHLVELVDLVVESGHQKTHGETWARFHRKMKVNKYSLLHPSQFDAACQYLSGKMDDTSMTALIQKHFHGSALMVAAPDADRTASAFMAAQGAASQIQKTVFNAVLAGGDDWKHQRWEVSFITDSREAIPALVQKMGADEFVTSMSRLASIIHSGRMPAPDVEVLFEACARSKFKDACANTNRGYGQEVAAQIKPDMSWADLHAINQAAAMEVWMRSSLPQPPAIAA